MSLEGRAGKGKQAESRKDLVGLLTPRELQVLRLIVEGKSNKEIGTELVVSTNMAKLHVSHVLQKLEVTTRTQAAVVYIRSGWNNRDVMADDANTESTDDETTKGA